MCVTSFSTQLINFDVETFPFYGNVLSEYNPAFVFYNYFVHCQMFRRVIEFSVSLVECFKRLYFPWSVIYLALVGSLSVSNVLGYQAFATTAEHRNVCVSKHSWGNVSRMWETLYEFILWRSFVGLCYYLVASLWKTADVIISSSSSSPSHDATVLLLLLLAEHYPGLLQRRFCIPMPS
jgi:hypothetical protein